MNLPALESEPGVYSLGAPRQIEFGLLLTVASKVLHRFASSENQSDSLTFSNHAVNAMGCDAVMKSRTDR